MKRLLIGEVMAAVMAVAGCGVAHISATAQGSQSGPGVSSGRPARATPTPVPLARKQYLPALTTKQVASRHLLPRKWTLVHLAQGGTAAEISYPFGGCLPKPKGALVTQSGKAVTLSLEAPRPTVAADCAPVVATEMVWVHIPALGGRTLRHPVHH